MRVKSKIGNSLAKGGIAKQESEEVFVLDATRKHYLLSVIPMGAVRMTQSDRWKTDPNHSDPRRRQRPAVTRYFEFRDALRSECSKVGFELKDTLEAVYCVPMPDSWSEKKKARMNGMPHKSKPDIDNITKAFMDALRKEDHEVWKINAQKRHAYKGAIIIFE